MCVIKLRLEFFYQMPTSTALEVVKNVWEPWTLQVHQEMEKLEKNHAWRQLISDKNHVASLFISFENV